MSHLPLTGSRFLPGFLGKGFRVLVGSSLLLVVPRQLNFCLLRTQVSSLDMPKTTTKYLQVSVGKKERKKEMVERLEKLANYFLWLIGG